MKVFLFLYPISYYFDSCLTTYLKPFENANNNFWRINDIIDARYRKRGYKIFWLMFSKEDKPEESDLSIISSYIKIDKNDIIIPCGVSFSAHVNDKKYPNLKFVFNQISKKIKVSEIIELTIGGFHQWDCVDKFAEYAYFKSPLRKDIPVMVDEDTTELFFERTSSFGDIPLIREKTTPEDLGLGGLKIGLYRKMREGRPWFARV